MRVRHGLLGVVVMMACVSARAEVNALPGDAALAGWGATEWVDMALQQAEAVRNEVDREEIHINVLMALCQVPGQQQRVAGLADEAVQRLKNRGGDPVEADYQLPLAVYAYARIGDTAKARETHAFIGDDFEKIWGLIQMGWGTGERGDVEATLGVIADIEIALNALDDEYERGWYESELPLLLALIGETDAAIDRVEAITLEDTRADAWLNLGDLFLDFDDEANARACLEAAQKVMAKMPDGGEWQTASVAALTARLGEPAEAGVMMIKLGEPWDLITVGGAVARSFARAGNDESAERMLDQMRGLAASVRFQPDYTELMDIAYMWSDAAEAARESGRMDRVGLAWEDAKTPLNRGMIAAGIAVEISWNDWLEQREE